MPLVVTPTTETIYTKLRAFVVSVVPAGVVVLQGLQNRDSMPPRSPGFVAMTAVLRKRLATNIHTFDDPAQPPEPPYVVGTALAQMNTQITVQLDCYGADSGDWATMLATMLRDPYGCDMLAPEAAPLYADEPRLAPLIDAEKQWEQRWIVGAVLQANFVTVTPQEFAGTLGVELIEVDEQYPP